MLNLVHFGNLLKRIKHRIWFTEAQTYTVSEIILMFFCIIVIIMTIYVKTILSVSYIFLQFNVTLQMYQSLCAIQDMESWNNFNT